MALKRIRLELARDADFPAGSHAHGYAFTAPLDHAGHIDAAAWKANRDLCRVRRFWGDEAEQRGHLVRKPGGSWAFHYDIDGEADDDEAGYRFGDHAFKLGEYVSIRDDEDRLRTFHVVAIRDIKP
jgi:hypothetical protein